MKPGHIFVPILIALLTVSSGTAVADISWPGSPQYANNVLGGFITPTVRPGETVHFSFNVSNPYDDDNCTMMNVVLTVGVYRYATQEETRPVDEDFDDPPLINDIAPEIDVELGTIVLADTVRVELDIATDDDTPHGSYFSQSTYFVRFNMTFNFPGNSTLVVLRSRGFFTEEQWDTMVSFEADESIVDVAYMKSLGVDGLIPDSSFGIKVPIPRWPLGVLIAVCCGTAFMALYYFVLDNPGRYPKLEKRFYQLRGKLHELRSELQNRGRK